MTGRVLHVIETLGRGGAERLLCATLREMDRDRYPGVVAYFRMVPGELRDVVAALGGPVECLGTAPSDPRNALGLRRLVRRHRIDLVHAHLYFPGLWAQVAARLTGVPIVISVHNLIYEPEIRLDNPRFSPLKQRALRAAEGIAVRIARPHVIAVSEAVRRSVLANLPVAPGAVTVVHNGVDLKAFSPPSAVERAAARARAGVPAAAPVIVAVGRFVALKGHRYLLEALHRLRPSRPDVRLLLVGAGPLGAAIEQQAATLGLTGAVRFLGAQDDVREIVAAADVLVAPSLSEGFGLSVVEAMAMAVPVVASRTGGLVEIVDDGRSGLLVTPRDPDALATALGRLLGDPGLRHRFGACGRAMAEAQFDVRATAQATARIYERALGARAA